MDDPRTEERFHADDEHLPYWASPWPAAVMLAGFVVARPPRAGERVLEIGCGLGAAGLAAAITGRRVTLTDYDEDALAFAKASAELSGLNAVSFARLDWRDTAAPGRFDLILGADVLFERRWVAPIAAFLAANLADDAAALICDPNRSTAEGFTEALSGVGLAATIHGVSACDTDGRRVSGSVYDIRRA